MKYNDIKNLSNAEIALLEIIAEKSSISGYKINTIIQERGFREWADIGQTSIYIGLEKLQKKELVSSKMDTAKKGKGPLPRIFKITKKGKDKLREEILRLLSSTRERERVFDLGIAGLPYCSINEAACAIKKRVNYLSSERKRIKKKFKKRGGKKLPFQTKMIFEHIFYLIEKEIFFLNNLNTNLKKQYYE